MFFCTAVTAGVSARLRLSSLLSADIGQPIAIETRRSRAPRVRHLASRQGGWEIRQKLFAAIRQRPLSQGRQHGDGPLVEIALRHRRVGLPLAPEEAPDVPPILEQQTVRLVLRVTLKEDKQASSLLDERVDASLRPREHAIAGRLERVLGNLVPPRVRHPKALSAGRELMIRHPRALEDAEALVTERLPADTVDVEDGRVRSQAGADSRERVLLGPLQNARQAPPVRLVRQVRRARLGPGHDEPVEAAAPEIVEAGVEGVYVVPTEIRPRNLR